MKQLMTMLLVVMMLAPGKELFSQGIASAMGEMSTVVLDGPFDALRNPALLAQEERSGAIGFTLIYQSYDSYSTSTDFNFRIPFTTTVEKDFTSFDPETLLLIGGAAFYARTDRFAFGMSFSQSYNREESENFLRVTVITPGPITSRMYSDNRRRDLESQSNISCAFLLKPGLSVGAQYQLKYTKSYSEEKNLNFIATTQDSYEVSREEGRTYTSVLNIGALYSSSSLQLGAIISTGEYAFTRTSYENSREDFSAPLDEYNISDVTSLEGVYNSGPGMVFGIMYSLTGNFAVAAEAGFRVPIEYEETHLSPTSTGYVEAETTTENRPGGLFSAGIRYRVDENLVLGCGYLVRYFKVVSESTSTSGKSEQEIGYLFNSLRFGLEKKIADDGFIVLFSAVNYSNISMMMSESGSGGMLFEIEISRSVISLNAGISYKHLF